jgi:NADPH:quinone reductase-like Zn-dependent oxidoreductase
LETLTQNGRRYQHYDFTDISPSFFEHAKESFNEHLEGMSFRVLNIEKDPLGQGFEAASYDVVLAANVLHATKNMHRTLSNARSLLKPGGRLLVFELTNPTVLLGGFGFGVLPGWWLSEEDDRAWGPLMALDSWNRHLVGSGFSGLDAVFEDFPDPAHQSSSVLVSSVPKLKVTPDTLARFHIVVNEESILQGQVAESWAASLTSQARVTMLPLRKAPNADLSNSTCIILEELDFPILASISEQTFAALKHILSHCAEIVWLTQGADGSVPTPNTELVTGLARAVRTERPDLKFSTVSFERSDSAEDIVAKSRQILQATQYGEDNSFRVANGLIHVPRLIQAKDLMDHISAQTGASDVVEQNINDIPNRELALQIGTLGMLDTLRFEDDSLCDAPLGEHDVEFKTMAFGLDTSDLAVALGKIDVAPLSCEAAGIVTRTGSASSFQIGDRVFGLCLNGAAKTHARTEEGFLAKMPDTMTWTEAAALPSPYMTAYAALMETGILDKEETVLIHSAANTVGQAAIQISQQREAEVFATVSSTEERAFLEATYCIPGDHIFSNNNRSFRAGIMRQTDDRGVDVVLNDLTGEFLEATWQCVAPFGRLVHLGLEQAIFQPRVGISSFKRNNRFEFFSLQFLARHDPVRARRVFQRTVNFILDRLDEVRHRLPVKTYGFAQASEAFSHVQSGQRMNKVVLQLRGGEVVSVVPSRRPTARFSAGASYVIAGGFGGLGRSVARWMVSQGARNLILLSRNGPIQESAQELLKDIGPLCINIAAPACDVTDSQELKRVIDEHLTYMPPIRGCIQGTMVLKVSALVPVEYRKLS